jgi:anti-sigma factor RsiW
MQPSAAGHPGPEELTAYEDGEASADVRAHLAGCSICSASAALDMQTQRELRRSLYRFDCPNPHTLGEYQLDLLDPVERTSVAAHANECDACYAELQTLRAYLAAPLPVSETMVERVRRVVASLLTPSPAPGLELSGLRGAAQAPTTRVFAAGDATVSVGRGQAPGMVVGLVVVDAGLPEALTGREARLIAAGGSSTTALLDDLGNFEFGDVAAGSYVLEVSLADSLIVIEELRLD